MTIRVCSRCHRSVIPMSNGKCPSCQAVFQEKSVVEAALQPAGAPAEIPDQMVITTDGRAQDAYSPPVLNTAAQAEAGPRFRPAGVDDIVLSILFPVYGIGIGMLASFWKGEKNRGSTMIDIGLVTMAFWTLVIAAVLFFFPRIYFGA